jgi:hypothetical protein
MRPHRRDGCARSSHARVEREPRSLAGARNWLTIILAQRQVPPRTLHEEKFSR